MDESMRACMPAFLVVVYLLLQIRAINHVGHSRWSVASVATHTKATTPMQAAPVKLHEVTTTSICISWELPDERGSRIDEVFVYVHLGIAEWCRVTHHTSVRCLSSIDLVRDCDCVLCARVQVRGSKCRRHMLAFIAAWEAGAVAHHTHHIRCLRARHVPLVSHSVQERLRVVDGLGRESRTRLSHRANRARSM